MNNLSVWIEDAKKRLQASNLAIDNLNLVLLYGINCDLSTAINLLRKVTDQELKKMDIILDQFINSKKPLAHLVGFELFYGYKIKVTQDTLIPRSETEELVLHALNYYQNNLKHEQTHKVLDLCTGSGAIGILFSKLANEKIDLTLSDISAKALEVAKENLQAHGVKANVILADLLTPMIANQDKYDIIISNPPYIAKDETIQTSVYEHEPHLALFAKQSGYEYYYRIIDDLAKVLTKSGALFLEIGHQQGTTIVDYAKTKGFNAVVIKDINNKERIVKVTWM